MTPPTRRRPPEPFSPMRWEGPGCGCSTRRSSPARRSGCDCETPEQVADAIRRLAVRGAPAIGVAAAYGLVLGLRTVRDPARSTARFEAVSELLGRTRPTAVNLRWALERGRKVFEENAGRGPRRRPRRCSSWARELHAEDVAANRRIGEHGADALRAGVAGAHPLQHRRARHRRLRHGARGDHVRLAAGPAGTGVGGRDAAAAPGRAAHRLGAASGWASPSGW